MRILCQIYTLEAVCISLNVELQMTEKLVTFKKKKYVTRPGIYQKRYEKSPFQTPPFQGGFIVAVLLCASVVSKLNTA